MEMASVYGRCRREAAGYGCGPERVHRHVEEEEASEHGRNLRVESVHPGGRTGRGYRSGPRAGCLGVCCVVVSI